MREVPRLPSAQSSDPEGHDPTRPPPLQQQPQRQARGVAEEEGPFLELVVAPRTPQLQATEDALSSMALVALIGGTRPAVTTAMVHQHLRTTFGVADEAMIIRRHAPEDFLVRFTRREDLEAVLGTPSDNGAPFTLIWRRWSRLSRASAGL